MTRTSTIVTLAILSSVLTPVVVKATGMAETPAAARQATVETAAVAAPASSAQEPACMRRVKVVYAGYGEAHAVACTTAPQMRR
jgi:hypothetical protein